MRMTARKRDGGAPLRQAMKDAGMGLQALADRTRAVDPDGKGVSYQLLGFLTQDPPGRHGRDTCWPASADLIETALGARPGSLFDRVEAPHRGRQPGWEELGNVTVK
jgi:hypothetical protein